MKKRIIALAAAVAVLTSCEKDDKKETQNPKPKSTSEILMDRQWDIDYVYTRTTLADSVLIEDTDTLNGIANFKANKVIVSQISGEPQETGTWEVKGDSIYIDDVSMYIEKLTDNEFVFSKDEANFIPDSIPLPFNVYLRFSLSR